MTTEQVCYLYKCSKSLVNKVRSNNLDGISTATVNTVRWLLKLDVDFLKALFTRAEFGDMVRLVVARANRRHHKNIYEIIRFADKCMRRHKTFRDEFAVRGITDDDFSAAELMGIYLGDAKELIANELFQPMCDVALELSVKDQELRSFIAYLYDVSGMFIKLSNKKGAANEVSE